MTGTEDIIVSNALTGTNTNLAINSERDAASFLFQHQLVQINFYASTEIAAADSKWGEHYENGIAGSNKWVYLLFK